MELLNEITPLASGVKSYSRYKSDWKQITYYDLNTDKVCNSLRIPVLIDDFNPDKECNSSNRFRAYV